MARRGLTLIELLIVIGVIALLLALSFPALLGARNQAQSALCLQNVKTLSLAWLLYKDDNDDRLVGGIVGTRPQDWVQKPMGVGSPIERRKEGIRQGALFRYTGGSVDTYRCPADERRRAAGHIVFRSYSIVGGANGEVWNKTYIPAEKYSEIARPTTKYIFVEDPDPSESKGGSWLLNPQDGTWVDPLAIWHSRNGSILGFADGHVEPHSWVDRSTREMYEKQEFFYPVPPNEGEDLRYMLTGFPQKTKEAAPSSASGR
jgi:prepilin-type N-terminal cleavage/methylation domain-containing protein/prepilin-type processing-associated H-X9-DG protein